jgi:leucine dehydrogenase
MSEIERLLRDWDGEAVVTRYDAETGAWLFLALHSSVLGPATGGTRMRVYPDPADGLRDAMRLAEGMTHKWAALDLPVGGGKAVLALSRPLAADERRALLSRYAALVESLRGSFGTGEDLGTTPEDMAVLAAHTRYVHGARADGSVLDPGPFTARGVLRGIEAAVREVLERQDLDGTSVLVQGVGDVGAPLCHMLVEAGVRLTVSDPDEGRVASLQRELELETVDPDDAYETPCDVFAPCALGGLLDGDTIPLLRCSIVAGSANNQLGEPADAERLHERGIVYAPDYVINGGGALAFALYNRGEDDIEALLRAMDHVGTAVGEILREAAAGDESPAVVARRRVDRTLARGVSPVSPGSGLQS